jgi:hypothetical protein
VRYGFGFQTTADEIVAGDLIVDNPSQLSLLQ